MRKLAATSTTSPSTENAARAPRRATTDVSQKAIARLALYRRILARVGNDGRPSIFSHEIASICGATSCQVRRDLMTVGFLGHPVHGYDIEGLLQKLELFLEARDGVRMALVGIGNLGCALLSYFNSGSSQMNIVAAFDSDPAKTNRAISGCHAHAIESIPDVLAGTPVDVAVIAVPAHSAQQVTDMLIASGIRSLINLAPVRLRVPQDVFVEDVDLGIAIEKAAFYARTGMRRNE